MSTKQSNKTKAGDSATKVVVKQRKTINKEPAKKLEVPRYNPARDLLKPSDLPGKVESERIRRNHEEKVRQFRRRRYLVMTHMIVGAICLAVGALISWPVYMIAIGLFGGSLLVAPWGLK